MRTGIMFAKAAFPWILRGPLLASLLVSARAQVAWIPSNVPGTNNWSAVAASVDGTKLVATSYDDQDFNPGGIYTSTNTGATWTRTTAPSNFWYGVTSSTNGQKLAAVILGGGIFTSTDSGKG